MEHLQYPIGRYKKPENITGNDIEKWITEIELFPKRVSDTVKGLSEDELNWRYRPGGWTIKQVVHHCADSHINSFIRFKLALTEDTPTIKPYFEDRWAELADTTKVDITESIKILEGLHRRWVVLLKSLNSEDLGKEFVHPDYGRKISLAENIALYAWHANHHLGHIKLAITNIGKLNDNH